MSVPLPNGGVINLSPGVHPEVSDEVYYGDLVQEKPTLSRSAGVTLIDRSPLHCWSEHPRLGAKYDSSYTDEMEFGTIAHRIILGRGKKFAIWNKSKTWQGKEAGAFWDEAIDAELMPIKQATYDRGVQLAQAFNLWVVRMGMQETFEIAKKEVMLLWSIGDGLYARALLDAIYINEEDRSAIIFDIKTTKDVNPKGLGRHCYNQDYHTQRAFYIQGLEAVRPDLAGRIKYFLAFAEQDVPHAACLAELDGEFDVIGKSRYFRMLSVWKECLLGSKWPSYPLEVYRLSPPEFALPKEIAKT